MPKRYFRDAATFRLIVTGYGSCIATDRITVDGAPIGFMYRETPDHDTDSGWRFFAGDETDEYANNPERLAIYDVNTIANYDASVTPYLDKPFGSAWIRDGAEFIEDSGFQFSES